MTFNPFDQSTDNHRKFAECVADGAVILDSYFPEIRKTWEAKEPNSFIDRLAMTLYIEMINSGVIKCPPNL